MYKVAVIGDKDSIYGFASIGVEIHPCDDTVEAVRDIRNMADNGYGVIYITEQLASQIEAELDTFRERPQLGMRNVSKSVEQAVGSDILSDA